ncbi:GNAT family N-acetyltransferase [Streptomyces lydicus]|uniref:GNAT family N-acetyltransferase n=1 Tax=Streptomyces lydicus TaxID=47763 RepID=UPI0037AC377C
MLPSCAAVGPFQQPFTHGPALCLTARARRTATPVGAVFAATPEWAYEHPLSRTPISAYLVATTISTYGLAVAPGFRRRGIARALLTERESRARGSRYRLATLLHTPDLTDFYQRLGYTTAHRITVALPDGEMELTQPKPYMTAVKPLHPSVPFAPCPVPPGRWWPASCPTATCRPPPASATDASSCLFGAIGQLRSAPPSCLPPLFPRWATVAVVRIAKMAVVPLRGTAALPMTPHPMPQNGGPCGVLPPWTSGLRSSDHQRTLREVLRCGRIRVGPVASRGRGG